MIIISSWYGAFLLDTGEGGRELRLLEARPHPPDPEELAGRHRLRKEGRLSPEEQELVNWYRESKKGEETREPLHCLEERLATLKDLKLLEPARERLAIRSLFRDNFPAEQFQLPKTVLKEALALLAREDMDGGQELGARKLILLLSVREELLRTSNLLREHLHEHLSHQLGRTLTRKEQRLPLQVMGPGNLMALDPRDPLVTLKGCFTKDPLLQELAGLMDTLTGRLGELDKQIGGLAGELMPNSSHLVGPLLAARLMARAGGLQRLSRLPASTIQTLGAEKALFKHLRDKSPSPKHGLIFQHPPLRRAPRGQRGKIARALASKLAIAARQDQFSGELQGDALKEKLKQRLRQIKEKDKTQN